MPLLVDGHNLIGQMPGISLADPDDEARLVMLLRRYATRKRGRQVVVVFDHGVYGHPHNLNGYGVTCYFAKSPRDADAQLIKRLDALSRPADWTLVTSDRHVADAARQRRVRVVSSQEFAAELLAVDTPKQTPPSEEQDAQLSEQEIEEWLRLFDEGAATGAPAPDIQPDTEAPAGARHNKAAARKKRKRR